MDIGLLHGMAEDLDLPLQLCHTRLQSGRIAGMCQVAPRRHDRAGRHESTNLIHDLGRQARPHRRRGAPQTAQIQQQADLEQRHADGMAQVDEAGLEVRAALERVLAAEVEVPRGLVAPRVTALLAGGRPPLEEVETRLVVAQAEHQARRQVPHAHVVAGAEPQHVQDMVQLGLHGGARGRSDGAEGLDDGEARAHVCRDSISPGLRVRSRVRTRTRVWGSVFEERTR